MVDHGAAFPGCDVRVGVFEEGKAAVGVDGGKVGGFGAGAGGVGGIVRPLFDGVGEVQGGEDYGYAV